ncbi:MAG: Pyk, partial [candidate division CPR3 bacterium GW2011_GWE2_35_7]
MKKTKIVATLGPASESATKIKSLIKAGVNVFRFNLKHNDKQWHSDKIELVQKCANEMGKPIAILLDLVGRDLRLGKIPNKGMLLKRGQEVIFADENNFKEGEIPVRNFIAYKNLKEGVRFSADSGSLFFKVFEVKERFFKANALKGGFLKENKGVNMSRSSKKGPY